LGALRRCPRLTRDTFQNVNQLIQKLKFGMARTELKGDEKVRGVWFKLLKNEHMGVLHGVAPPHRRSVSPGVMLGFLGSPL